MLRLSLLAGCVVAMLDGSLRAQEEEDVLWHGLHLTFGTAPGFVYPFDGRAPRVAAVLHNHQPTIAPAVVTSVRVNGLPLDPSVDVYPAGAFVIPAFDYGNPSISSAGVYSGGFGVPPAVGETKTYRFEFTFSLAPGAISPYLNQTPTDSVIQDIRFTNLGDNPVLAGPMSCRGTLRVASVASGPTATNLRVEVATPYSPWYSIPVAPVPASAGTAVSFSQALPLRNDWHVRLSADGCESRVVWLGYSFDPTPTFDVTLAASAVPDLDYRRVAAIPTATGFWRGAVAESEGTVVVFPGQENWKTVASDVEARALRSAGRIAKYRFDGTKIWEHAPGWETWGGDMTADGRYVAYVLNPTVRPFYVPTDHKLVLLDGATGAVIWSKSVPPNDVAVGRKLESIELTFSPDARWLAVGSMSSGQVTLVDRATGNFAWSVPNSGLGFGEIRKLRFSPDSESLYCGGTDSILRKLRVSDGALLWRALVEGPPQLNGLNVSADGAWVVVGTKNFEASAIRGADGVTLWQAETQSPDAILAPDARHFATGGGQVYRTTEGSIVGMTKATGITRFTPDGRYVVQLGRDFRLYDLGGKLLKSFEASGLGTAAEAPPQWAHLTRDGRYAIVLARDLLGPSEVGIAIYERRPASTAATVPVIVAAPLPQNLTLGAAATLSVGATGTAPLAYRWQRNGLDLPGAESAALVIPRAAAGDAGTYRVIVSNAAGTTTSADVGVGVAAANPANPARIANLSVRASVGATPLIVGFAIGGAGTAGTKLLLIRGAGPALASFSVAGYLGDPRLNLFSGTASLLANDNWSGDSLVASLATQVGAFPFADRSSADAALAATAVSGSYTVHLSSGDGSSGIALAEIYDGATAFAASTPRLVNISARAETGAGNDLIAGFVITGPAARTVLVRGIGPTLAVFGIKGALADPQLTVFRGDVTVAANDDWYQAPNAVGMGAAAAQVGAFALPASSTDAAVLLSLPPGSYTARLSGAAGASGNALVEVYEVP